MSHLGVTVHFILGFVAEVVRGVPRKKALAGRHFSSLHIGLTSKKVLGDPQGVVF